LLDRQLRLFSVNGVPLASVDTRSERIYAAQFSDDGHFVVTGGDRNISIRRTHDFSAVKKVCAISLQYDVCDCVLPSSSESLSWLFFVRQLNAGAAVRALALTADEQHLLVGLQNGKMIVYALDAKILRERTLQKLTDLGF
jgi:WD40 repeat protein